MELMRSNAANQQRELQRILARTSSGVGSLATRRLNVLRNELQESFGKEFKNLDEKFTPQLNELKQSVDALTQQIQALTENNEVNESEPPSE